MNDIFRDLLLSGSWFWLITGGLCCLIYLIHLLLSSNQRREGR